MTQKLTNIWATFVWKFDADFLLKYPNQVTSSSYREIDTFAKKKCDEGWIHFYLARLPPKSIFKLKGGTINHLWTKKYFAKVERYTQQCDQVGLFLKVPSKSSPNIKQQFCAIGKMSLLC